MAEQPPKSSEGHHAPKSTSELFADAKLLAEAAQTGFNKDAPGFDKAKVAGAAEDILEATKSYGKLDETSGVGQYVDKAEGYLHKYHSSSDSTPAAPTAHADTVEGGEKAEVKGKDGGSDDGGVLNMAKKGLGSFFS
ncbi:hypothetical protein vseg_001769 [Gypsophila vaccaria]